VREEQEGVRGEGGSGLGFGEVAKREWWQGSESVGWCDMNRPTQS
jgi:hypothetical protein